MIRNDEQSSRGLYMDEVLPLRPYTLLHRSYPTGSETCIRGLLIPTLRTSQRTSIRSFGAVPSFRAWPDDHFFLRTGRIRTLVCSPILYYWDMLAARIIVVIGSGH